MDSTYEDQATVLRQYLTYAKMTDAEFGRRLESGDPAAAIIFAASRLATVIGEAQAEIVRELDSLSH